MKRQILILFFSSFCFFCDAQTWHTMGQGVTNSVNNANINVITYYNGKITIGGRFKRSGTTNLNGISQWDGNYWNPLGTGLWLSAAPSVDYAGAANTITLYNNMLYAGGGFDVAGGISSSDTSHSAGNIAKWNGTQWLPMTQWGDGLNSVCMKLQKYHGNLILSGFFNTCLDSSGYEFTQGIAKWNDTVFSSIGQFYSNHPASYDAGMNLCTYNNKLIAGGYFNSINGSPYGSYGYVASYNDTTWDSLGSGLNDVVFSLAVYNGELYAGGDFTATGDGSSANHVAKWNGTQWQPIGEGLNDSVWVLHVDSVQNKLYAGGAFTQTGLGQVAKHIAEWTGSNWVEVGGGTNNNVYSLFSKDSNLYVGGAFTQAGAIPANRIAVWGNNPVGIKEINKKDKNVKLYPNPNNGHMQLSYSISEGKRGEFNIMDITGRLLATYQLNAAENILHIEQNELSEGIYLYNVIINQNLIISDKLVIISE